MRGESSITNQLAQAMLDIEELKTAQMVGESQIKIKEFVSDPVTITSTGPDLFVEAYAWCDAEAATVTESNVLITHCDAEIRSGDTLVNNKSDGWQYNITSIETTRSNRTAYQANIYRSSTSGSNVPVTTYTVRFHVWSSADLTLTVGSGRHA